MQAHHGIHLGVSEHPRLNHRFGTTGPLLRRLKDQLHRALKAVAVLTQVVGRSQGNGHMAIVAAGMHHPIMLGTIGDRVLLLDGQGIHVRPNPQHGARLLTRDHRHHTGAGDPGLVINPPGPQPINDKIRRQPLPKPQLWPLVQVPPPLHQRSLQRLNGGAQSGLVDRQGSDGGGKHGPGVFDNNRAGAGHAPVRAGLHHPLA
jgi:hypothetical protein